MTPPPARPAPQPAASWPTVFDGAGALVVNCAVDPDALLAKIARHASAPLAWIAVKLGGSDVAADTETLHCVLRWQGLGLTVGAWTYCYGPPTDDVARTYALFRPAFVVYDVEAEYKADEGGRYEWASELVREHRAQLGGLTAAVTSYGGCKRSIDFASFAAAGWPILAQCYDAFESGDEITYVRVYPSQAIHRVLRSLAVGAGESVFRPEGLDE